MWLPVSTFAALCFLLDAADGTSPGRELELMFRERSKSDWEEAWHRERYSRCRDTLKKHLYWACEKDIYRLTRRSQMPEVKPFLQEADYRFPWLSETRARRMIRSRKNSNGRRSGSSSTITSECCSAVGCTWEEYAEYCPTNKRKLFV